MPATIGVLGGGRIVGLDDAQLDPAAPTPTTWPSSPSATWPWPPRTGVGRRDHGRRDRAVAAAAGIGVFATGGLGGVHREAGETFDESADLTTLARTPIVVVCAGVKSILDVAATLERLETLGVAVVGYRTRRFPGFYVADCGFDAGLVAGRRRSRSPPCCRPGPRRA